MTSVEFISLVNSSFFLSSLFFFFKGKLLIEVKRFFSSSEQPHAEIQREDKSFEARNSTIQTLVLVPQMLPT